MKRIILCLDGTWNSAYAKEKRIDGSKIIKPSNVLKLARAIKPVDEIGMKQVVYYDTGVGSLSKYSGVSNYLLGKADKFLGGIWGAGFETNIEDALTFLIHNYSDGDEVYIFGFSRGAATARALTQFISWMDGIPKKIDVYFLPHIFRYYIKSKGKIKSKVIFRKIIGQNKGKSAPFTTWSNIKIKFLGVWDTVLSLGSRLIPIAQRKFYMDLKSPANCVINARQALAIDEKRFDFKPWVWEQSSQHQSLQQRWFAGVHSNIGGGYDKDGLANITLHWMKNEIKEISPSFTFDHNFFNYYGKHYQAKLMNSKTIWFYIKDFFIRNRLKDYIKNLYGTRKIKTQLNSNFSNSGIEIDFSSLVRMISDPKNHQYMNKWYRPNNLISYIKTVGMAAILKDKQSELNNMKNEIKRNKSNNFQDKKLIKRCSILDYQIKTLLKLKLD